MLAALLLLVTAMVSRAADVSYYLVAKAAVFNQSSSSGPVPKGSPARFLAQVVMNLTNSVTNATVQYLPSGTVDPLVLGANGNPLDIFSFQNKYTSQAALDAAFPNGNYQMVIDTIHDGTKTLGLDLNGNGYPSSNPFIKNPFDSTFGVVIVSNPAAPFTLTWAPWVGGTANDFIQVQIATTTQYVVYTPGLGEPGALNGTFNSLAIPANTLPSGAVLSATLIFGKVSATNSTGYPGAPGYAGYYSGTAFSLLTLAEDVYAYNIAKQQFFDQTGSGSPAPSSSPAFRFVAQVLANDSNLVTTATLQPSAGASDPLSPDPTDTFFAYQKNFPSEAALDNTFGSGSYSMQVNTVHDGNRSLALTLPADAFPIAPHVANWAALQNINPATQISLSWDPFSGAGINDDIVLSIIDNLGNSLVAAHLANTAISFSVPAATFQSGQTYQGLLQFRHYTTVDITSYPGATGAVRFVSRTSFSVATTGGAATPPSLAVVVTNGLPPFQIQLTGEAGRVYAVDTSSNLQTGSWIPLLTNTAVAGQFIFTDLQFSNFPARFYRGRAAN